jgi:N-acetylglutamate synthase-like GNAT family acetyltransferase
MSAPGADAVGADDLVVRLATVEEILVVRKSVLRPREPMEPSAYDASVGVRHIGAFSVGGAVGCATIYPSPRDDEPAAWQLRGMAVADGCRGHGIGGRVLQAAIDVARDAGAPQLWANARVPALDFYASNGFEIVSEEFAYGPAEIPHRVIVLHLSAEDRTVAAGDFPR